MTKLYKLANKFEAKLAQQTQAPQPQQSAQTTLTPLQKVKKAINAYRFVDSNFGNALISGKVQMPLKEDNSRDINYQKAINLLKVFLADATEMTRTMSDDELLKMVSEKVGA